MKSQALFSVISGSLLLAGQAYAQDYTSVSIDVSCPAATAPAACPAGLGPGQVATQTSARGINARGDIVGFYVAGGRQRGFLLKDGKYTSLEFPVPAVVSTIANGINPRGEIVGAYTVPVHDPANPPPADSPLYCPSAGNAACNKSFHYWRGNFSTVMFPTTVDENGQERKHPGATVQRITPEGDIYGCLHDHDTGMSMFGAAWTPSGAFSLLSNGGLLSDSMAVPMSMNNGATPGERPTIVGFYSDMSSLSLQHGYVIRDGMFEQYDATSIPADPAKTLPLTAIWDINPSGQFVGTYRETGEASTKRHGFVQNPGEARPVTLDFICRDLAGCAGAPPGTAAFATIAFGINPDGVIVGQYALISGGPAHGFIAVPSASGEKTSGALTGVPRGQELSLVLNKRPPDLLALLFKKEP
jgi:hypothetical protein